jgi:poly(3-hydroxybutyrate) depolymerase
MSRFYPSWITRHGIDLFLVLLTVALSPGGTVAGEEQTPADAPVDQPDVTAQPPVSAAVVRRQVMITSTADGTKQPCYVSLPASFDPGQAGVPLIVSLHTWSGGVEQRSTSQELLEKLAIQRGWIHLFPHFRGPNDDPDACGSTKAQQDILDAVAWAESRYPVDPRRIYLTGTSGGGHMTMLMVGRHPRIWAAASAWVGISDLAAWHQLHADDRYGAMLSASCGGPPGDGPEIDSQYRERSPLTHLARAIETPLDIAAGIHDGHRGSVPIRHSLDAFNTIAAAVGGVTVSDEEIRQLSREKGRLDTPQPSDLVSDPVLGRKIYLRRQAGKARVTIFEGGHEGLPAAAIAWLEKHVRDP